MLLLSIARFDLHSLVLLAAGLDVSTVAPVSVPFAATLPSYLPLVALLGLAGLLGRLAQRRLADSHTPLVEQAGQGIQ